MSNHSSPDVSSCDDGGMPPSKRFKASTAETNEMLLKNSQFGDYARVHQGHINIEKVDNLVIGEGKLSFAGWMIGCR